MLPGQPPHNAKVYDLTKKVDTARFPPPAPFGNPIRIPSNSDRPVLPPKIHEVRVLFDSFHCSSSHNRFSPRDITLYLSLDSRMTMLTCIPKLLRKLFES